MKYKAAVFDIDGTITDHISSWRLVHEKLGLWDKQAENYQKLYIKGLITYKQFCDHDAALWKGVPERNIKQYFKNIKYFKNAKSVLIKLRKMGLKLIAVSSGLQYLPERMRNEGFPFHKIFYNELLTRGGVLTGKAKVNVSNEKKGEILKKTLKIYGINPAETICVCDSVGDIEMLKICGYAIAFNCTDKRILRLTDYECKTKNYIEIQKHMVGYCFSSL